uniref:Nonstructural polyprotein n=1 Tax=Robinvale bee virus 8 TaxID=2201319 RepID=A0A2U8JQ99_9VIRU|nr:nonstructural polyprotein [Robinvale bee virus 8]
MPHPNTRTRYTNTDIPLFTMIRNDCDPESNTFYLCDDVRHHVVAMIGERPYVLHVRETPDVFQQLDTILGVDAYWVTYRSRPVRKTVPWTEYNVHRNSHVVVHPRLRGGMHAVRIKVHENYFGKSGAIDVSKLVKPAVRPLFLQNLGAKTTLPWITPFSVRAKQYALLDEYLQRPRYTVSDSVGDASCMQKGDLHKQFGMQSRWLKLLRRNKTAELQAVDFDPKAFLDKYTDKDVVSFVEDVTLLCLQLLRAQSNVDRALAITVFIKLRTGTSLVAGVATVITDIASDLFTPQLQSADDALQTVTDLRSLIGQWESLQHSALVQQITRVYKYAVALGVFALVGVKIDEKVAYLCKKELASPLMGVNFMTTVLDTIALFIQRTLLYAKTGKWETFVHGPKSFAAWFDACQKVKREFQFRGDLEAQGTNYHKFVGDLRQCVEEGRSILKYGNQTAGMEMMGIKKLLNEMQMMQAELSTFREAQKSRRPPFGLLVYGKTCVGKSTFTSMLYQFAGKFWDLPTSDEYRYTRNTCDDFWSGWDSMKWFLLLDDIAFGDPNSKIVDNSLTEVIQIMNDVPLVPNQASLEDKGRNPLRARMVVATTNTRHLNAHAYFACPIAVQRRFPFVLVVSPKGKYARDDDPEMIDPVKLPPIVDEWPNFWNIRVERVVAAGDSQAQYEEVQTFTETDRFFEWLGETMRLFESVQTRAGAGILAMQDFDMCRSCCLLKHKCVCEMVKDYGLQAKEYQVAAGYSVGDKFDRMIEADGRVWYYEFEPHTSGECNYIMTTTVSVGQTVERKFSAPVIVVAKAVAKVQSSDIDMADILGEVLRIQGRKATSRAVRAVHWCADMYLRAYVHSSFVRRISNGVMEWSIARKLLLKGFRWYTAERVDYYTWLADTLDACYINRRWKMVLGGLVATTALITTYGLYKSMAAKVPEVQGLRQSVSDEHFAKTERVNVWKRDDYQTSSIDRSEMSASFANLTFDQVAAVVERNTARVKVSNGIMAREGNAFSPCGHLWMTNNHTLFDEGDLEITLSVMPHVQGASTNVVFKLRQVDILRMVDKDLAFFEVHSWETKRDLRGLIRSPTLRGAYTATYVTRTKGLATKLRRVKCTIQEVKEVPELKTSLHTWTGWCDEPTVVGDCGSPLFVHQPVMAVVGIHTLGNQHGSVWATEIDSEVVAIAVKHFDMPVVQCSAPEIGAPSRPKLLVDLRQRSPLRWLEEGSLNVYGSYAGQAVTSRSKVRPTLLGRKIIEEREWKVDFVAPELRDYRPWRHALVDSTQKKYGSLSGSTMKAIAQAYADDVLDSLPEGVLSMLEPLSDKATINGIDGVRFIDKMNFKSSMGEPYNKTKKAYLSGVEGDMKFDPEVTARIERIKSMYARNQRACPVFSGKLKDEPRATKKVAEGKVRVFTAAPADWSFVVRQFLLPVVKLMQENPFVFEASPGCTVQSLEWQSYYNFLTHFGFDRMVAGDYGKFDKKMEALIILLSFRVLRILCQRAGWCEEQLCVIDCIAEDTAYAFVNFDGDLVEFFGSNPSGHPLTVIINCIANALYMRFAFVTLCPFGGTVYEKARRFKEFVRLLTYGDDNTMGVSRDAEWFNHTAIQSAMADIGVEYTMADKESHSRPFIHISEISYLKRSWRWDEDVGAVVAPLETGSIEKMLTICNPSGNESPELHMASVMSSALNEWFWHGRTKFEEEREWLWSLAQRHDLVKELEYKGFPTWDQLNERFWKASTDVVGAELGCEAEHPRSVLPN